MIPTYARGPSNDEQLYRVVQTILRWVGASLNEKYVALRRKSIHHFEDLKHKQKFQAGLRKAGPGPGTGPGPTLPARGPGPVKC